MKIKDKNTITTLRRLYGNLKKRDFVIMPKDLMKNQRYLWILRIGSGLTVNGFASVLKLPYSWLYNLENDKIRVKEKGAINIIQRLNKLLKNYPRDFSVVLKNYYAL